MKRWHLKCAWYVALVAILGLRVAGLIGEQVTLAAIGASSVGLDAIELQGGRDE